MKWWKLLIAALSAWSLFWKEKFSRKSKEKQDAKENFDKAVDDGDRLGVIDAFNDAN